MKGSPKDNEKINGYAYSFVGANNNTIPTANPPHANAETWFASYSRWPNTVRPNFNLSASPKMATMMTSDTTYGKVYPILSATSLQNSK